MPGFLLGQFYHFFITSDNSRTIRCQFIIIADNSGQFDNSVSVHHYCFPCIKSVSWIHGKTSKTDRR